MSAQLNFEIENQIITRTDSFQPVARSQNYLRASFTFSDDWDGITDIKAIFRANGNAYEVLLDEHGECAVPWEALTTSGTIRVSVYGGDRITANMARVTVLQSGYTGHATPTSDPTKDTYEALLERMDEIDEDIVDAVTEALTEAKESGDFDGEDGYSPRVTSSRGDNGVWVNVDDKYGGTSFYIFDGLPGEKGDTGVGIQSISLTSDYKLKIIRTDGMIWISPSIRGEIGPRGIQGLPGPQGEKGDDYVLTSQDKTEIASLIEVPSEIDDTAGAGDTDKTWSADKINSELANAGSVQDVTVNGTSIVGQDGVAEIPVASNTEVGVVKSESDGGVYVDTDGTVKISIPSTAVIKAGTNTKKPIVPYHQHTATFYGLAKAAGDTTQASSSNAVGTYTDNAKASIKAMLGVGADQTQTVLVDGTVPVITAVPNARYICGEVLSVDFTAPAAGICELVFTSGSTVAVLTITGVTFPEWFDSTTLETNTVYEISIADGRAVVATWDVS